MPSIVRIRTPKAAATQGIRDLWFGEQTGEVLILLGRSTSRDHVTPLDVAFQESTKPEGVTTFWDDDEKKVLIVDDGGGFAVLDYPKPAQ